MDGESERSTHGLVASGRIPLDQVGGGEVILPAVSHARLHIWKRTIKVEASTISVTSS